MEAAEYGGTVSVNIFACRIFERPAFILRTDASEKGHGDHPPSIVEIASDLPLRQTHRLSDGDRVTIELDP